MQSDIGMVSKIIICLLLTFSVFKYLILVLVLVLTCDLHLGVFDVLAYTDKDVAVPFAWIESDAKLIHNPQMVKLHSFDTKVGFTLPLKSLKMVFVLDVIGLCYFIITLN